VASVLDIVGFKTGVILDANELRRHVSPNLVEYIDGPPQSVVTIRSETAEELIVSILYSLGNVPQHANRPITIVLFHRYRQDSRIEPLLDYLVTGLGALIKKANPGRPLDPKQLIDGAAERFGTFGVQVAVEFLVGTHNMMHSNPWSRIRSIEWKDTVELKELFQSERLETYYGTFIDQRFIDYLAQNSADLNDMHWRKFEALACEYFERAGFHVEIGPGRNDDGVDARVWPKNQKTPSPPLLLIQCKREQSKISKVVVKALWADVIAEEAESGLIVTINGLSPGALKTKTARAYPIEVADRRHLRTWLQAMRTPNTGPFMLE